MSCDAAIAGRTTWLPLMSRNNATRLETAFTVSIEAREGVTTGISGMIELKQFQLLLIQRKVEMISFHQDTYFLSWLEMEVL